MLSLSLCSLVNKAPGYHELCLSRIVSVTNCPVTNCLSRKILSRIVLSRIVCIPYGMYVDITNYVSNLNELRCYLENIFNLAAIVQNPL